MSPVNPRSTHINSSELSNSPKPKKIFTNDSSAGVLHAMLYARAPRPEFANKLSILSFQFLLAGGRLDIITGGRGDGEIAGLVLAGVRAVGLGDGNSGDGDGVGLCFGVGVLVGVL